MICHLCPRRCGAVRTETDGHGFCAMPAGLRVARAALHQWEEPVISGTNGSGTVFFSGCTLRCVYCQNHEISADGFGKPISPARLREIFDALIAQGAHNINLVTPTHFLPWILPALTPPLPVPVVYNCGGYERVETLKTLEGKVQIYLPDLKYADSDLARRLSAAPDYFDTATAAIREMVRQTGPYVIEDGLLVQGTVIRHLVLPGQLENTKQCIDWVARTFRPGEVLFSLMAQYTPQPGAQGALARHVTRSEYRAAVAYMENCGIVDGFTQERTAAKEEYTPPFDLTGV
ncbi:MAG: 4Fe-4S cluster-binding domain-containing protein [Clostridiales bacterium]|nr:4Fe-4S cluster-binding domain-containing protein [Candidatus Cacconaster stercorequi]